MGRLDGKRILITQSSSFMGPALRSAFAEENAEVLTDDRDLTIASAADDLIRTSGRIDALVVNLAAELPRSLATETSDKAWTSMFDIMVHPMGRLVRAVLPQMIERRNGKVLVMTSGSALRGNPRWSAYAAARGAQVSYVRSVGMEVAPHNVQVNAIAQSFVENPVYFPPGWLETSEAKERMPQVPAARLAKPSEDGHLATFLVSAESDFFVGQIIPFTGGWVS